MSSPVAQVPSAFVLAGVRTGEPVATAGLSRWADEVAHVTGHLMHKAGEAHVPNRPAGHTLLEGLDYSVHVPYSRSPGAQVIRVEVEIHPSNEIGDSQTITATLPTSAVWIDHGGLDGSRTFYNAPPGRVVPRPIVGWADVSACTVGALDEAVTLACVTSSKGAGIMRATVHEAPLATLAIDAGEPGWDAAATRAGRPVVDGGAASPRGVQRLHHCLDEGRAGYRQHLCLSGVESADTGGHSTTPHWHRVAATLGAIDWFSTGSADPCWYLVVRDLYTGTAGTWSVRVRYRTSDATACELRVYCRGGAITGSAFVGAGAEVSATITLAGTSGAWAWTSPASITMPADGTDGLVRVRFEAKGPGSPELLSIACIALVEDEP